MSLAPVRYARLTLKLYSSDSPKGVSPFSEDLTSSYFRFMTVEEFESEVKSAAKRAEKYLQMPPVVKVQEDEKRVLQVDEKIAGFSEHKYVVCDISFESKDTNRLILIRQPDGTLEHAPLDVRKRVNQVYFPRPGRKLKTPAMFEPEHLKAVLDRQEYLFVLDMACVQFDPFEKQYHEITSKAYQHINETKRFDDLRSTRHFGPLAFFLAWHNMIDDLLLDNIKRNYIRHAVELILLHHKLHGIAEEKAIEQKLAEYPNRTDLVQEYFNSMLPDEKGDIQQKIEQVVGKSPEDFAADESFIQVIETFTKSHGLKKVQLELALQTFKEENRKKQELDQNLRQQHGVAV